MHSEDFFSVTPNHAFNREKDLIARHLATSSRADSRTFLRRFSVSTAVVSLFKYI